MSGLDRGLAALAALCGLLGVAGSAAAAHTSGGETLRTAAQFLLFHAPAILALTGFAAAGLTRGALTRLAAAALPSTSFGLGISDTTLARSLYPATLRPSSERSRLITAVSSGLSSIANPYPSSRSLFCIGP